MITPPRRVTGATCLLQLPAHQRHEWGTSLMATPLSGSASLTAAADAPSIDDV